MRPGRWNQPIRRVRPQQRHVQRAHGEAPIHLLILGYIGHQPSRFGDGLAVNQDPSAGGWQQRDNNVEQRALAGAIGPDDAHEAAGAGGERHLVQDSDTTAIDREVFGG